MKLYQSFLLCGIFSISSLNFGCKEKQDAKVYSVARETPASPAPDPHGGAMPGMTPPGHPSVGGMTGAPGVSGAPGMSGQAAPDIDTGTPPPQWKMKAPTPMRLASFEVKGDKEATADISLIILGGAAGGVLDNVNRWQSQLGQPDFTAEDLAQKAQILDSPLGKMTVVDLQGLPSGADAAKDGRIVAAIVSNGGMVFFFKMRGNAELVGAQKEDFLKWASAVRADAQAKAPASPLPSPSAAPSADNAAAADATPSSK